jgi:transglutaminase-like putative cysteine protease
VRVGCEFVHDLSWPVSLVLQVEPRPDAVFNVNDAHLRIDPPVPVHQYLDMYGNICRRLTLEPGVSRIRYESVAEVSAEVDVGDPDAMQQPIADLPDEVLLYTLASRYCDSDRLANTAWGLFGGVPAGWARVQAVIDWVHANVTFAPGSTTTKTGASDVYLQRRGVCRDFAQLAAAFLRALNVPTRYCFGYLPDIDVEVEPVPMDFVAWLEAYIGGAWYTFDPRNNARRTGRVLIGRGRDALDVAMLTTYGQAPLTAMRVMAESVEAPPWSSALRAVYGAFGSAS